MPSALTHFIFNNELIKNDKYKDIFLLAGQGADTFFFYGYNIAKRKNKAEIRDLGYKIHSINPDKLYMEMLKYVFNKKGEEKELLIEFTRGFIYHYALDRNLHPYVFYHSGFPYTNKLYNIAHGRFESILDTLLMKKYGYNKTTRSVIKAKRKEIKTCSRMLYDVLTNVFDIDFIEENTYYYAYKDFRFVRFIADSRYGIKKAVFNKILKNNTINTISQPKKVLDNDKYDYLNLTNKKWVTPCLGEIKTDSVFDLFLKAQEDCRIIDNIIYNFKDNIVTQKKLTKFTNNINHDGRDLDKYMTYFKIIWREK